MKSVNILIPLFNEESGLLDFFNHLLNHLDTTKYNFVITLVDDGSSDNTWQQIESVSHTSIKFRKIKLSRNFGHQGAIFAGLSSFNEDAAIILDGDFQDDPEYIPQMIDLWLAGNDIVLANRIKRKENFVRRSLVSIYYRLQNKLSEISIPKNVGHYSLMDQKVVVELVNLKETKKFLLGLRSYVGFKTTYLNVVRKKREFGSSKMSFTKLLKLSSEGLIGFSTAPLNLIGLMGIIISIGAIIFSFVALFIKTFLGKTLLNWNFGLTSIYFLSGIQLLSISVLGQYISKIFDETKKRPQFIIEKTLEN
tara:strand:+ start:1824 stop:2747 length:924 start_codon:yes stop_codon:yes gene_type:complete